MKDEPILSWQSPEHHFDKKENGWYFRLAIITGGIVFLAFYFENMLFGIFALISGAIISFLSYKETKVLPIKITHRGIVFGHHLYKWDSYYYFWIEDEHIHGPRILLYPVSNYLPVSIIPINIEEVDLNELRETMMEFMEEEFIEESFIHKIFDKIISL